MSDYVDEFDEDAGLIDQKAIRDILEKATDALRSLGLTIQQDQISLSIQNGQTWALIPALIRPTAKKKLVQDQEGREAFNRMMAEQHDAEIAERAEKIRQMAADPDKLFDVLFADAPEPVECQHRAPEGICIDCGAEVEI